MTERIFVAIPSYGNVIHSDILPAFMDASKKDRVAHLSMLNLSSLTMCYNLLFAKALNANKAHGLTHFLLWHSDIVPLEIGWLDRLTELMNEYKADIMGVFSPLKDHTGTTSTSIDLLEEERDPDKENIVRYTLKDLYENHPPTFTHERLILNTGLLLIDLRKKWLHDGDPMFFQYSDSIIKDKDGDFQVRGLPECIHFSRAARKKGAKLYATREIKIKHWGATGYPNTHGWGSSVPS